MTVNDLNAAVKNMSAYLEECHDETDTVVLTAKVLKSIKENYEELIKLKNKADFVEVVRCKDCIWFMPKHIKLSDGTTRPYTDEEKKLPCGVTSDIGINVGSYCLRKKYWEQNGIHFWFNEDDFCSYGEPKTVTDTNVGSK